MKRSILAAALALALAGEALAGGLTTSKVAQFGILTSSSTAWVKVVGPVTTPATCATPNYFAIDLTTEIGRGVFRVLLAAQVQGLAVSIAGTGACTHQGAEDILYVLYNPPT